ncbi:MAG: DUF4192 domain-containing protein [Actinoplanes sp.]
MTPDCTFTVRCPADLIAITPYVIGFHPTDSIVVIGTDGPVVTFGVRYDLPPPPEHQDRDDGDLAGIATMIAGQQIQTATVIGYGPSERVAPEAIRLAFALNSFGVRVHDVLRVHHGRWWSYVCDDPRCCPPEGKPCQPLDSRVAAEAVLRGKVALPDRQALVAQVAPVSGPPRAAMTAATERARARKTDLVGEDLRDRRAGRAVRRAGRAAVQEVERRSRAGRPLTDDQVAWLGVLLVDGLVQDYALDRCDGQDWRIQLWTEVTRRAEPSFAAAPACLLGFAAWRSGNGALARVAVDRALKETPGHRLAALLDHLLCSGIGPQAVVSLSPPARTGGERRSRRSTRRRSR